MKVSYQTFGCKANQYDTERMRQELEARGAQSVGDVSEAEVVVVNTCTVTNRADAEARRYVRRVRKNNPHIRVVVAGCSAVLRPSDYQSLAGVSGVVEGHDPVQVAHRALSSGVSMASANGLVQIDLRRSLDRLDTEPIGGEILRRRADATRGWLKIQDGCDRKCSFCATRLARGVSRSRSTDEIVREARTRSQWHPELVLTGVHIGHYGRDLDPTLTLSALLERLLEAVPGTRFRLGSIEATEVDDHLMDLMADSQCRLAPHLHMPLQSGADAVLRKMRRWHTREMYRRRALEIAERLPYIGLGADIITGFPGETSKDHTDTLALVEELPFTYLHVFPFSPRDGTMAASLPHPVPQRTSGLRSRELRALAQEKGIRYRKSRIGEYAEISLEGGGRLGLTEDYLRVEVRGRTTEEVGEKVADSSPRIHRGLLQGSGDHLYIDLSHRSRLS